MFFALTYNERISTDKAKPSLKQLQKLCLQPKKYFPRNVLLKDRIFSSFSHVSCLQFWKLNEPLIAVDLETSWCLGTFEGFFNTSKICVWILGCVTLTQVFWCFSDGNNTWKGYDFPFLAPFPMKNLNSYKMQQKSWGLPTKKKLFKENLAALILLRSLELQNL